MRKTGALIDDYLNADCPAPVVGPGAAIYVATTGRGVPYKTLQKGILVMASGDTVIVKAGTYVGKANFINSRTASGFVALPSGTAARRTTICAEGRFRCAFKTLAR